MADTAQELPPLHILIVEDDDAAAHLIEMNLRRAGLDCLYTRVKNGEKALDLLHSMPSEAQKITCPARLVVLLDIRMPKMDGIQVLRRIKSSPRHRRIPVIMLTTSDRATEVETCYEAGCSFYIKKQVDYSRFVASIKSLAAFIMGCELPIYDEDKHG